VLTLKHDDILEVFQGQAWLAFELAEVLNLSIEEVRRRMIILENAGLILHVREGRFNRYFTTESYDKYLKEHPNERIRRTLRGRKTPP